MPALLLQSEAGGMLATGFTVLCLLSSGSGVERSSGSLPGRPNAVSGVVGTCPRATPVNRRSAVGMAHKRSIRLQCMMSFSNRFASVVPTEFLVQTDLLRLNQSPLAFCGRARLRDYRGVIEWPHKGALHTRHRIH